MKNRHKYLGQARELAIPETLKRNAENNKKRLGRFLKNRKCKNKWKGHKSKIISLSNTWQNIANLYNRETVLSNSTIESYPEIAVCRKHCNTAYLSTLWLSYQQMIEKCFFLFPSKMYWNTSLKKKKQYIS